MAAPAERDLAALRREIDRIDDALHDLLMARAAIVNEVAGLRRRGKTAFQPGREAAIVNRLLARNRPPLSPAALIQVWRQIFEFSRAMQAELAVAVGAEALTPLACRHFGAPARIMACASPDDAQAAVQDGTATVAVLPWVAVDLAPGLFVVAGLPFGGEPQALVIAASPPDPSGHDRSVVVIDGRLEAVEGFGATVRGGRLLGSYAVIK